MARHFSQGRYTPLNAEKYAGNKTPIYRSSWELTMMRFCDNNPSIIQWASEAINIPYRNPFTGKNTIYVPDFFIVYVTKGGDKKAELIEIKPFKQTSVENAGRSVRDKAAAVLNMAKWEAATKWCARNNIKFRVISENEIYHQGKKKK